MYVKTALFYTVHRTLISLVYYSHTFVSVSYIIVVYMVCVCVCVCVCLWAG